MLLVRTGKPCSSSRPCNSQISERPQTVQKRNAREPWRLCRLGDLVFRRSGQSRTRRYTFRRTGEASFLQKKFGPLGPSDSRLQLYTQGLWMERRFKKDSYVVREFKSLKAASY